MRQNKHRDAARLRKRIFSISLWPYQKKKPLKYFEATAWINHIGYQEDLQKGRKIHQKFIASKNKQSGSFSVTDEERRQWAWVFTESFLSNIGVKDCEELYALTKRHYKRTKESLKKYVRG